MNGWCRATHRLSSGEYSRSGKSTTLYAALSETNVTTKNIITIEDPVEFKIDGVNQVAVRPDIGLTFASALRAFLRQDPDIILVGEVRDLDTAQICVRAARRFQTTEAGPWMECSQR